MFLNRYNRATILTAIDRNINRICKTESKVEKENTIGKSLTNDRRTYYSGLSNKNILKMNNIIKILFIVLVVVYSILILFYRRLMDNYNYIIIPVLLVAYLLINKMLHVSSKFY